VSYLSRFAIALFVSVPVLAGSVQAQGHDLAIDFRTSESGMASGKPMNGSGTAHGVFSKGRVRYDMKGNTRGMALPGMAPSDSTSFIILDNGATIIFLQPETKQYMRMRPAEAMDGMQKMLEGMGAAMKFDVSGDDPKVEKLGPGPTILGHHTTHYRVTGRMKVSVAVMGQSQGVETSTVSDEYVTPDIENITDPFHGSGSSPVGGMFGASFKTYMDKMKVAQAKLGGFPLRMETHVTTSSAAGQSSDIRSVNEITAIHTITASPSLFEVPAGYTQITMPTMPNMPPRQGPAPSTKH